MLFNNGQSKPKHIALHQQLGIDLNREIPKRLLMQIISTPIGGTISASQGPFGGRRVLVDTQLKYRANFALNTGQEQSGGLY